MRVNGNVKRTLIAFVAVVLLATLSLSLFACNKNKLSPAERDRINRENATAEIKTSFLGAVNEDWVGASLADVEQAGEYVVLSGWTDLVCDVLKNSTLQTAKIMSLANAMKSESGKALAADFAKNAELIIPILREIGFTPTDISHLVYDLVYALVDRGATTVDGMLDTLTNLKLQSSGNVTLVAQLNRYIANLGSAKSVLMMTSTEKANILNALSEAEEPLAAITAFAYNSSVNALSNSILDAIAGSEGALTQITTEEVSTLVSALLANVSTLKDALGDGEIAKLNRALSLIIEKFDERAVSSALFSQIVTYAKSAYMVVDVIPTLCDIVYTGGGIFRNQSEISSLMSALGSAESLDKDTKAVNAYIMGAKVIAAVLDGFTAEKFNGIVDMLATAGSEDYQKAMPLFALDLAMNLTSLIGEDEHADPETAHPDILDYDTFATMLVTVMLTTENIEKLKETHYRYTIGEATVNDMISVANACSFGNFGVENPFNARTETEEWYNYFVTIGVNAINDKMKNTSAVAQRDMKAFVEEYYAENSAVRETLNQIASLSPYSENALESQIKEVKDAVKGCSVLGLCDLVSLFIG